MDISVENLIVSLGYAGVLLLMVTNGFFSVPSSQILYIIAGYFVSTGELNLWLVAFLGALGNTIGNILLYEVSRKKGIEYITRFKLFPEREVRKVQLAFQRKGGWFLFIGKLLPAIKVFVPIPAGIGKMPRLHFLGIILTSSFIWSLIFISIGYVFGKGADVLGGYSIILFGISAIVVFAFYRYVARIELESNS